MGLGAEVVDLVGLHVAQQIHQRHAVRQVDVVQHEAGGSAACGSW